MKYSSKELKKFSSQIRFALDNYTPHRIDKDPLNAVLICGTGPSGTAGRVVKNYFHDKIDLPVEYVSGYTLPRFAGKNTLVVIWSYSGNTEEALAVYDIAREKKCRIIVISSGGKLAE
ncbi:MAG TPA: SIS domain-containing protein, partial [Anseongella sp.]|nr:SIS domain-containing protein [Anseongella sp.]